MKQMKQNVLTLQLRDFMDSDDGWGRKIGQKVFQAMLEYIESQKHVLIYNISLKGVKRVDASFPRESVIELAKRFRGERGVCLLDITNVDLIDNWDAAAMKKEQPIFIWNHENYKLIGPKPKAGLRSVLDIALSKNEITATEISEKLSLKITNASTKLKYLVDGGYLVRYEDSAKSGGKEYLYYRIK